MKSFAVAILLALAAITSLPARATEQAPDYLILDGGERLALHVALTDDA